MGRAFGEKLEEGHGPGFPLPQEKGVHEGGQGLGVEEGGHPAGQHQGVPRPPVGGSQGNPGAGQNLQHVWVVGLKGDGKGHRGEIGKGPLGLQGKDRGTGAPVLLPLLGGGQEGPLAHQAGGRY